MLAAAPSNYSGGIDAVAALIYVSVVTPVFEELIFRGYVWNRLRMEFKNDWSAYVAVTVLFALWHLGYADAVAFRSGAAGADLARIMLWKVLTGLGFGIVLGGLRLKTKNCYSTMLLHGVMNIFGG